MATAIITGISGQDGAYLARLLLDKGYDVVGTTRDSSRSNLFRLTFLDIEDQVTVIESTLDGEKAVSDIISRFDPDEVYNLSAQSSVGYSFQNPIGAFESNLMRVTYLLNAIRNSKRDIKFYQASSSEMFGNINKLPVKEDSYFHPSSPYGISKAAAHWLTINYREGYDLFAVCGILFNHESCLRGENYVTKKIIRGAINIANGELDVLKLGNLNVTRDWGYAPSYVEAMWLMLQQGEAKDYLVCSNIPLSLRAFVKDVFDHVNVDFEKHIEIDKDLYRAVDLEKMWGDNTKVKENLGWNYNLSTKELITQLVEDEIAFMGWCKENELAGE